MKRPSPHDRLLESARQLFLSQGIQGSTTKQIAELAEVNEATLFRQFGSKHGLLLGLLEDADLFDQFREVLGSQDTPSQDVVEAVRGYAIALLDLLDWGSEFLRSLIGESGQFSDQNCRALGRVLTQLNRIATHHLAMTLP
ncbi:MAG: helix-turn-helix domain-containing protein [Cyanobacteria bacterium J06597_1]